MPACLRQHLYPALVDLSKYIRRAYAAIADKAPDSGITICLTCGHQPTDGFAVGGLVAGLEVAECHETDIRAYVEISGSPIDRIIHRMARLQEKRYGHRRHAYLGLWVNPRNLHSCLDAPTVTRHEIIARRAAFYVREDAYYDFLKKESIFIDGG